MMYFGKCLQTKSRPPVVGLAIWLEGWGAGRVGGSHRQAVGAAVTDGSH